MVRKPMPVGISDLKKLREFPYYFVDKSLFIKAIIDNPSEVILFARPRRFGKTITMSMIKYYFSLENRAEHKKLFADLAITKAGEKYSQEQGKYPVIFFTLKDVKFACWADGYAFLGNLIQQEYSRCRYLLQSERLAEEEKRYMESILQGKGTKAEYAASLGNLTAYLHKHHGIKPILLIDEYDVPIQAGYMHGYYAEIIEFMRVWLSGGLKDNINLHFALMTGILRVAKESIFSGLNNLEVNTILSKRYSDTFGFTQAEVERIAADYEAIDKLGEISAWYDGYRFGETEIYNPWSVINYFKNDCEPLAYWLHTSDNQIIHQLLQRADHAMKEKLQLLMNGDTIESLVEDNMAYGELEQSKTKLFSFLTMTGYLKVAGSIKKINGHKTYVLALPNREIKKVYEAEIVLQLVKTLEYNDLFELLEEIAAGNTEAFQARLQMILLETISMYDGQESFYHGLILVLTAIMASKYKIRSNRESGYGRFDLAFIPKEQGFAGILMEFKVAEKKEQLEAKAKEAVQQIEEKKYATMLADIETVYCYGIAFRGKDVKIVRGGGYGEKTHAGWD